MAVGGGEKIVNSTYFVMKGELKKKKAETNGPFWES